MAHKLATLVYAMVKNRFLSIVACLCASSVFLVAKASAREAGEQLGTLAVSDLFLEPQYSFIEGKGGAFLPGNSFLAGTWTRDRLLSALVKVGSKSLLGVPGRYAPPPQASEITIIEGYAELDSEYGRVRFGVLPIPFGLEGGDAEERLIFPRSLLFQTRFVNLRDAGVTYRIGVGGFFSDWAIHNGEGPSDLDGEQWFTARWGWDDGRRLRIGFSGSEGRTNPKSTNPGGSIDSALTGFVIDQPSRIRIANGFVDAILDPLRVSLDATAGDTLQNNGVIKYRQMHADVALQANSSFAWLARFDLLNPRNDIPSTQIMEISGGLVWRSRYQNSALYVLATKQIHQDVPNDVHRGLVFWRITPTSSSLASSLPAAL